MSSQKGITPEQKLAAYKEHGSFAKAGKSLGIDGEAVRRTVRARYPELDPAIPDGMKLTRTTTLYDFKTGEAKIGWVRAEKDLERQKEMMVEAIEALKKSGMGFSAIAPHIKKLSDAGEEGAAEELREILRENIRIGREKEKEIGDWKTNFESKKQQTIQQSQQQQENYTTQVREHASKILNADIAELSKDFPYLNRPSEPLPTDTPAVARAKQDAITAFEAASQAVSKAVGSLDPSKAPPEKALEAQGRVSASAVQGIILREHVLPRVKKELAELRARNAELEAKVGKIQTAGKLSRAHAAAASAPAGAKAALPESTEDAAKQIAREMGITIDS